MFRFTEALRRLRGTVIGKIVGTDPDPHYSRLDEADGLAHRDPTAQAPAVGRPAREREDDADAA
ncbi:hypothetical protein [Isoptericola jiangsuensis]|nr:hypothetical protein [Isoptericola jiangsuensis]